RPDGLAVVLAAVEAAGAHVVAPAESLDTRTPCRFYDTVRIFEAFAANVRASRKVEASTRRPDSRRRIADDAWEEVAPLLLAGSMSVNDAARRLGVNRSTVYRRLETGA